MQISKLELYTRITDVCNLTSPLVNGHVAQQQVAVTQQQVAVAQQQVGDEA